jgi:hypothetical protein
MADGSLRPACALLLPLLAAGCASTAGAPGEPLPVTVSAANYSQLSTEELYARVHGAGSDHPEPPAISHPDRPIFYAFVRGETFPSDTSLATVYRELATPLAERGYFNVLYEYQAGYKPNRIDYLLRVHCGVRRWRSPIVRTDKVTWGNYGLLSDRPKPSSAYLYGDSANIDSRAGPDANQAINIATYLQSQGSFGTAAENQYSVENQSDHGETRDYCIVVVEAFRFSDVVKMKIDAPCVWATFVAVPLRAGQEFSGMLRTMARTATPYFGATTDGIQRYDVAPGRVLMGEPVEVPRAPQTKERAPPQTP